jgi:hydroxymethylpyrimidine/phosphomethylpyrimidine kinase
VRRALTIAGSDSSGGAGIQADLKTFASHGVYGLSAITAVTAQNTLGVTAVGILSADLVTAQIEAVMSDLGADAAKTGMLGNVDPVMIAKSGDSLLDDEALGAMKSELLRKAFLVTPNIPEAETMAGMTIRSEDDCRKAARRIVALGARTVVIKGGHLPTADIVDLLYDGHRFVEFRADRVPGTSTHGTGCTFAAAITARLALGDTLEDAIARAQGYIANAIRQAPGLGSGHGPMDHFAGRYT